jgi:hypothetical protein
VQGSSLTDEPLCGAHRSIGELEAAIQLICTLHAETAERLFHIESIFHALIMFGTITR